LIVLLLSVVVM